MIRKHYSINAQYHLKGCDVEVVCSDGGVEGDCAVGHVVVPLQLSSAVFCLVELLYLHGNKF